MIASAKLALLYVAVMLGVTLTMTVRCHEWRDDPSSPYGCGYSHTRDCKTLP